MQFMLMQDLTPDYVLISGRDFRRRLRHAGSGVRLLGESIGSGR